RPQYPTAGRVLVGPDSPAPRLSRPRAGITAGSVDPGAQQPAQVPRRHPSGAWRCGGRPVLLRRVFPDRGALRRRSGDADRRLRVAVAGRSEFAGAWQSISLLSRVRRVATLRAKVAKPAVAAAAAAAAEARTALHRHRRDDLVGQRDADSPSTTT